MDATPAASKPSRFNSPENTDRIEETEFDVVVSGTGLEESILAGSLGRSGLRILHLDENDYYGDDWATLTLEQFTQWVASCPGATLEATDAAADAAAKRGWNIDLSAKGLSSAGTFVETLISSNAGRYLEFKNVDRTLVWGSSGFTDLPASRGGVFKSKELAPMEKRRLMQLMKLVHEEGEGGDLQEWGERPLPEYLDQKLKASQQVKQLVLFAILRCPSEDEAPTLAEGLRRLRTVGQSVGRYGPTDMIYPTYGVSELPQSLCRVCAIYRGVYILRRRTAAVLLDAGGGVRAVRCGAGQVFPCRHYIRGAGGSGERRAVVVVTEEAGLFPPPPPEEEEGEEGGGPSPAGATTTFAVIPPSSLRDGLPSRSVTVFELTHSTMSCPQGYRTVHFTQGSSGSDDLREVAQHFYPSGDPKVVLSAFFSLPSPHCTASQQVSFEGPTGKAEGEEGARRVWLCNPPSAEPTVDAAIERAKKVFADVMQAEKALRKGEGEGRDEAAAPAVAFQPDYFLPPLPDPEGQQVYDPESVLLGVPLPGTQPLQEADVEKEKGEEEEKEEEEGCIGK